MDGRGNIRIALARHEDGARESAAGGGSETGSGIGTIGEKGLHPLPVQPGWDTEFYFNQKGGLMGATAVENQEEAR